MVKTLKHRYLGEDFSNAGTQFAGAIKISQLDSVSLSTNLVITLRKKGKWLEVPLVGLEPTIPGLGDQCLIH